MSPFMVWANNILLGVGWLAGLIFLVWYTKRFGWWRNEFSAHLACFSLVVELFYSLFLARPLFDMTVFLWVRLGLFTLLTAVVVWRLVVFIRTRLFAEDAPIQAEA